MSAKNVQLVESIYAAMKEGNIASLFGKLSSSIKIWQSDELPWGGSYEGLQQGLTFFGKVNDYLVPAVAIERFLDSGDFVIVIGRTQGSVKKSGHAFDVPLVHQWEVRDGKVVSLRVFLENATMLAALAAQ